MLLVLDGLGWEQLQDARRLAPTLASMAGGPITTVAPTTTATALTLDRHRPDARRARPVGYRIACRRRRAQHAALERASAATAGASHPPRDVQPFRPFLGTPVRSSAQAELRAPAFTEAHLRGSRPSAGGVPSTHRRSRSRRLLAAGERVRVRLLRRHRQDRPRARLRRRSTTPSCATADRLVGDVLAALPGGAALLVTADHGQVEVGDRIVTPDRRAAGARAPASPARAASGGCTPARARPPTCSTAADAAHGDSAWVRQPRADDRRAAGSGRRSPRRWRSRLGDVALVARDDRSASTIRPTPGRSS